MLTPIDLGAAGSHDDLVALPGKCPHLGLNDASDPSASKVIVDNENEHGVGEVCLSGNLRKAKLMKPVFSGKVSPCPIAEV